MLQMTEQKLYIQIYTFSCAS